MQPVHANESAKLVEQASRLKASGNYDKAIDSYVEALRSEPANLSIQDALFESAKEIVNKAPKDASSYIALGNAYAYRGDYAQARNTFMIAIQLAGAGKESPIATAALSKIRRLQPISGNSHSASAWLKANDTSILSCPTCGRETDLVPVISHKPTLEESATASQGKAYLALGHSDNSGMPEWYCLNCHKLFASSAKQKIEDSKSDLSAYQQGMQRRIKRAWFPPKGNESKRVVVGYTIHKDGNLSDLRITNSSGVATADEAALKAVTNAAPFRPLPAGTEESVPMQFTFDYNVFTGGGGGSFRRF